MVDPRGRLGDREARPLDRKAVRHAQCPRKQRLKGKSRGEK